MRHLFMSLLFLTLTTVTLIAQEDEIITPQDLAPEQGQFITIEGVEIYFEDYGEIGQPTVMLLHGFGGLTFTWRDNIQPLVQSGYRVIAFDRPPFGLSDKGLETDYSTSAQLTYMLGLMDALEVESATLVGHSAGGGIISYFSTMYPERVDALVFVAGAVPIPRETSATDDEDTQEDNNGIGSLFELAGNLDPAAPVSQTLVRSFLTPEAFVDILSSAYYDSSIVTDEVATGYQIPLQVTGWEAGFLTYFATDNDLAFDIDTFTALDVPMMLIWGENDTWVAIEAGSMLAQIFPQATFITYSEVGHLPMEENTAQFNTDLLDFLATIYE